MGVALSSLAARIQASVPAVDSVPGDYDQIVKDAVSHVSDMAPMIKESALVLNSGTATYDLPGDFSKLIWLESVYTPDGVIVSDAGLIPIADNYQERIQIAGGRITFVPTPAYAATREMRYTARYLLDGSNSYPDMTEDLADLVVVYGRYLALTEQATDAANKAWSYSIGDERIDMTKRAQALRDQAKFVLGEFTSKLRARPEASRGRRYRVPKWAYSIAI